MFIRLVYESFRRQTRRKLLVAVAVTLGAAVSTAMIAIATGIGDKVGRELRAYGANLVVTPEEDTLDVQIGSVNLKPAHTGSYLIEADLPKIKGIFWRNNITGFAPELPVNVSVGTEDVTLIGTYFSKTLRFGNQDFSAGVRTTFPWWKVGGTWPADDSNDVLVGEKLAARMGLRAGSQLAIKGVLHPISGILSTGGAEDDQIVAPVRVAQRLSGRPGAVRKILVSAVTKPEDAFASRNPDSLSPADRDRWYCSPYPQSIAFQLTEAIPHSHADQIRQVAQNEGAVLTRIEGLIFLITLAALLASALAVSAAMATTMFERRAEVGLMKSLGAGRAAVASIFFAEASLLAIVGGLVGFAAGGALAHQIGRSIFDSQITVQPVLLPVIVMIAVIVTFAGSAAAIRRA